MGIAAGTRLGVYELLGPTGSGGMGEVYRARDTRLNRTVAIKVLSAATLTHASARARFQREALAIAALNHPHICTLHDIGNEGGVDFIVMEHLEGETLSARLARGALPVHDAIVCAREVASAVDAAHRHGVIHRDLKPSNIMLTRAGAKLLDFGLAKVSDADAAVDAGTSTRSADISHDGAVMGTLRYMAPELLSGLAADARSDVFSLGAVLYEMLAGEPPFKGANNARIIAAILTEEPRPLLELRPELPPALEWIGRTCLAKDPDERWQDAREVVRQLNLLEQGHASPATPTPIATRRARTRGPVAALAVGSLVAAVILAVASIGLPRGARIATAPADHVAIPHVVVLPCRPIDGETTMNRAHCDGMAATLTATLAQLTTRHSLQVTPASLVHERRIASAADARRELGASHALEGSLIRTPSGVRVTYALVETASARQVDALTVSGTDADMFAMQDAVLNWALGALRLTLARNEAVTRPRTTQSADAYAFALQGRGYLLDYQRSGAIDIAIGLFRRALEIDARYAAAHGGLGEAFWLKYEATKDTGLVDEARASCRQAMNLDPGLAAAYVCAARIASGTGEHEAAIVLLERALQADAANDDAYGLLARAHEALGRPELALATYQRAVQLRPQYWATHVWLGAFHRGRGNDAEAAREYERAVELTPDNAQVRGILAGMYVYLGRYDDALAECRRSLALAPSYVAYVTLGGAHYRLRQFDAAVTALEQARVLLDDFRTAGNLARAHYWAGQRERARELFVTAVRLGERELATNPRNNEVRVALAEYYARLGRGDESLAHLREARLDNPHFMFFAAMTHNLLGDVANARSWLDRAVAAGLPAAEVSGWIDVDQLRK